MTTAGHARPPEAPSPRRPGASWRRTLAATAALAGVVALLLGPLATVDWFRSPEGPDYLLRLELLGRELLAQGRMPRWLPELAGGHGYPLFTYYAPGSLLLALPLHLLGLEPAVALRVMLTLAALGGAAALAATVRTLHGSRGAGLVAAALHLASPFWIRSLYADGNLSQVTAHALAPVVLLAWVRAADRRRPLDLAALAVAVGVFTTLHTVSTLMDGAMLAALGGLVLVDRRGDPGSGRRPGGAGATLATAAFGLLLSCWFWLPALVQKPLVQSEVLLTGFFDYRRGFVAPSFLGAIGAGAGAPLLIGAGLGVAAALWSRRGRALTVGAAALGLTALALGAAAAQPVWEAAPLLRYIQPNRLAGPATLALALAAGAVGRAVPATAQALGAAVALALVIAFAGAPDSRLVRELPRAEWQADPFETCGFGEYLPRTVQERPGPGGPAARLLGEGQVVSATHAGTVIHVTARTDARATLVLRAFDYPGWAVSVDGTPTSPAPDGQGRITVPLDAGTHDVTATLTPTALERGSEIVSGLAWAALVGALAWSRRRATRRGPAPPKASGATR